MNDESKSIKWRAEIKSFIPKLDLFQLSEFYEMELNNFIQGVEKGIIISFSELHAQHMHEVKLDDNTYRIEKKPGSEKYLSDSDACNLIDAKLRNMCGNWIPQLFTYHTLSGFLNPGKAILPISRSKIKMAKNVLISSLFTRREEVNLLLEELHTAYPIQFDQESSFRSNVSSSICKIVNDELDLNGCDECWFSNLPEITALYMESVSCVIKSVDITNITFKYFRSWVEPEEDVIVRFADEIAAIGIKEIFYKKYGY